MESGPQNPDLFDLMLFCAVISGRSVHLITLFFLGKIY